MKDSKTFYCYCTLLGEKLTIFRADECPFYHEGDVWKSFLDMLKRL